MSCPPQSKMVRKELLKDLREYGVQLERSYPSWPPPYPDFGEMTDISPARGPHVQFVRRSVFGDEIEEDRGSPKRDSADPDADPKRLWYHVKRRKEYSRRHDTKAQSAGFPTAFWRPTRISVEDASLAGRRAAKTQPAVKSVGPGKSMPQRVLSEPELRNAREGLKGQASLHTAAVSDRFRFTADMSAGAPVCIRGAGVGSGESSSSWASDASALINFHHGHIRVIAKSGIEPLKEPPKKKKKKKSDDIDHLQLSESGLFQPKYPIDSSLMSLRRLKKNMFPEVVRREQEEAARLAAARAAAEEEELRSKTAGLSRAFRRMSDPVAPV
uniref:Uncharacterized protein n=1 Tax=Alexandrium catenella TaxID=2925 RepID=A0A7S1RJ55_ALECA